MSAKKNTKTLYSKTNPVDITSLLSNININANITQHPFLNQNGGKRMNNESAKKTKKKNNDDDDDTESETDTDNDNDNNSDTNSQHGKGKKNKDETEEEVEEVEEEEEEEPEEEHDDNDELNEGVEDDVKVTNNNDELEENEEDDEVKTIVSENEVDDDDKETLDTNNKCYSKYAKDKDDDFDLDEYFKDDDIVITKIGRVAKPILFKYEKVRLLSDRSRQLAEGAKPMAKNTVGLSHKEIALLELKNKTIPLIIERPIPNAGSERWRLSELEIPDYD